MPNKLDKSILDLEKLLWFSVPFWQELSVFIRKWISADMTKGVLQGMQDQYRSARYVYLKNRWMYEGGKEVKTKSGKIKIVGGKRVYPYAGVSIRSNWTRSVNMLLTGQLIDGLEYEKSTKTSVTLSYKAKDAHKIISNERYHRSIRTLNEANQNKVVKVMEDELATKITSWYKGKIIITLGK